MMDESKLTGIHSSGEKGDEDKQEQDTECITNCVISTAEFGNKSCLDCDGTGCSSLDRTIVSEVFETGKRNAYHSNTHKLDSSKAIQERRINKIHECCP